MSGAHHAAFVVAFVFISGQAAAQCTKDTDCKGDRICSAGECVDAPTQVTAAPLREPRPIPHPLGNPYRVHRLLGLSLGLGFWALTCIGSIAVNDGFWPTTVIPVVGPLITYL